MNRSSIYRGMDHYESGDDEDKDDKDKGDKDKGDKDKGDKDKDDKDKDKDDDEFIILPKANKAWRKGGSGL